MEKRARRGLQLVSTVVRTFAQQTAHYEKLMPAIARAIAEAIPDTCLVTTCSEDRTTLRPVAAYDADAEILAGLAPFRGPFAIAESPLSSEVIERGSLFVPQVDVAAIEARGAVAAGIVKALGARGFIMVPMRVGDRLLGVISVVRRRPEHAPLDELDLEILEDLAGHAALAIENARLVQQLATGEKLRQTTQFLDAIIDNIPDVVFVKDAARLSYVRINRACEVLLGRSRADMLGKGDHDLLAKDEADFFTQKDRETLATRQLLDIPEEPIATPAGTRWMHTKKVPLLDEHGTPRFLLGISHDITERKRADAALRAAQESIENANKELEAFAYSIAHDLRTPLRSILGYSAAVLEDVGDRLEAQPRLYLQRMHEAAQRMATLIEELLGLARVSQADLVRGRVDLTAMAYSAIGGLQHATKGRRVEVVIQPNLLVDADPHMMAIVMDNLLDNAWKFTAKREHARIEVGRTPEGAFFVRDNGAGFDPAYADQLFGVFRRLHAHDEFPGTGIGLATVARIIHRHHGRVWAEGKPGEGATFYFVVGETL